MATDRVAVVTDSTAYLPPGPAAELGDPGGAAAGDGRRRGTASTAWTSARGDDHRGAAGPGAGDDVAAVAGRVRGGLPAMSGRGRHARRVDASGRGAVRHLGVGGAGRPGLRLRRGAGRGFPLDGRGARIRGAARRPSARARAQSAAQVQGAATDVVDRTRTLFYVDTLEYLRRGGRIGTAAGLLATSLSVKPLLQMVEGRIVPLEKVRTSAKAIARLVPADRASPPGTGRSTSPCITLPRRAGRGGGGPVARGAAASWASCSWPNSVR